LPSPKVVHQKPGATIYGGWRQYSALSAVWGACRQVVLNVVEEFRLATDDILLAQAVLATSLIWGQDQA
jgi:hypothetical protein